MRKWICHNCKSFVLAPERPRKNDLRRYCLRCSFESKYLVKRFCPTLNRAEMKQIFGKIENPIATNQRQFEFDFGRVPQPKHITQPWVVNGIDMKKALNRISKLRCIENGRWIRKLWLIIDHKTVKTHTAGYAFFLSHKNDFGLIELYVKVKWKKDRKNHVLDTLHTKLHTTARFG